MPGIVGIIRYENPAERAALTDAMVKRMCHEAFYTAGTVSDDRLGFSAGWVALKNSFADCLPLWNDPKDVLLVFSGEDFSERDAGETGDAGDLLRRYEKLGGEFFASLNGRCSGLLADFRVGKLVLFNDRYGLNRLYVHENADGSYFASEAKALLAVLPTLRQLDLRSLGEWISCGCALENRTLFQGISLMPPGSVWTFDGNGRCTKESYAPAVAEAAPFSEAEYVERVQAIFPRVLARYIRRPERIALSLTGGLDSRLILAHWPAAPESLACYTFGGMHRDCGDVRLARNVARLMGKPHTTIRVDEKFLSGFPALAAKTVYVSDGTMDVTGAVELYVNQIARGIAPVRLTGSYGGEILRGLVAFKPGAVFPGLWSSEIEQSANAAAETYRRASQGRKLPFVAFKQVPWHHYARYSIEQSQLEIRSPYLDNDLIDLANRAPAIAISNQNFSQWLPDGRNRRLNQLPTDRGVVAHPIPVVSNLRRAWQEFTFKAEYAYDYGMPQWLARLDHLLQPLHLEKLFLGRHKFYHFRLWYRDQLAEYVAQVLLDPQSLARPWLNRQRVETLVRGHTQGQLNATTQIHQLLSLELMQRQLLAAN